jgi:aspartyl-tRNA synthetase
MSRKYDAYTEFVRPYGAKGLAWIKVNDVTISRRRKSLNCRNLR